MYRVRIEEYDTEYDAGFIKHAADLEGTELDSMLHRALMDMDPCRPDDVICKLINHLFNGTGVCNGPEFWDGYHEAMDDLVKVAERIVDGWEAHDEKNGYVKNQE